jgi:hypothetical protein
MIALDQSLTDQSLKIFSHFGYEVQSQPNGIAWGVLCPPNMLHGKILVETGPGGAKIGLASPCMPGAVRGAGRQIRKRVKHSRHWGVVDQNLCSLMPQGVWDWIWALCSKVFTDGDTIAKNNDQIWCCRTAV